MLEFFRKEKRRLGDNLEQFPVPHVRFCGRLREKLQLRFSSGVYAVRAFSRPARNPAKKHQNSLKGSLQTRGCFLCSLSSYALIFGLLTSKYVRSFSLFFKTGFYGEPYDARNRIFNFFSAL